MTALKPVENVSNVRGVASKRYPINLICSHPECNERMESVHHIFGRPPGMDSDSWFVTLEGHWNPDNPLPHATGLCGSGTTGHHGDLEEHRAWIRYEEGQFVWYEREKAPVNHESPDEDPYWRYVGPLNPQPGSREGKPKRHKPKENGGEPRKQKTFSVKLPYNDDNLPEEVPRKFDLLRTMLEDPATPRSKGYTLATILDLALIQARDD